MAVYAMYIHEAFYMYNWISLPRYTRKRFFLKSFLPKYNFFNAPKQHLVLMYICGENNGKNNEKARHPTRKHSNIVYPGSRERKFSLLIPASAGPTRWNFLSLPGGV